MDQNKLCFIYDVIRYRIQMDETLGGRFYVIIKGNVLCHIDIILRPRCKSEVKAPKYGTKILYAKFFEFSDFTVYLG